MSLCSVWRPRERRSGTSYGISYHSVRSETIQYWVYVNCKIKPSIFHTMNWDSHVAWDLLMQRKLQSKAQGKTSLPQPCFCTPNVRDEAPRGAAYRLEASKRCQRWLHATPSRAVQDPQHRFSREKYCIHVYVVSHLKMHLPPTNVAECGGNSLQKPRDTRVFLSASRFSFSTDFKEKCFFARKWV